MKFIPQSMARTVSRQILKLQKNSPRTLFVVGIGGVVVSTVMACRATLKLEETVDEFAEEIKAAKELHATEGDPNYNKNMAYIYAKGSWQLTKLYGPSVVVMALSVGALTKSHMTLTRRNAALTASYSALSKVFDAYRERVAEEVGAEKEQDLYLGVKTEKIKGPDGKMVTVKTLDPDAPSMYARWFDESNRNFKDNPETNRYFLQIQENWANQLLVSRGHVFLQEVYDMLGFERSRPAQVVGWVYNNGQGDGYITFGIYDNIRKAGLDAGFERAILLDFNVDGNILDLI